MRHAAGIARRDAILRARPARHLIALQSEPPMSPTRPDHRPSLELLESVHVFPGTYQIKAIGVSENDFAARVVAAARAELAAPSEVDHSIRSTRQGRHVAVTLELTVQTPEQVRAIYARLHEVEGLTLLF
jgi:putative lipoic acid-binding regulatory protein